MAVFTTAAQLAAAFEARRVQIGKALEKATADHTHAVYAASKANMNKDIYGQHADLASFNYKRSYVRDVAGHVLKDATGRKVQVYEMRGGKRVRVTLTAKQAARALKQGTAAAEGKGKAKWVQTGRLRNSEKMTVAGLEGRIMNTASYALPRHDLGLAKGDPRAFNGSTRRSTRIAPWRKDAVAQTEPDRLKRYREAVWGIISH